MEGPDPLGRRPAAPAGHGEGCGEGSLTAKCKAGADEGAGLQKFYSQFEIMVYTASYIYTYTHMHIIYTYTFVYVLYFGPSVL